ncbi:hypothetical protein CP557_21585 [Natrinema ejinorense]|uniref:Uncharacterized protein n=1 Tax=Natrinema ejinorense TaxID=373386 RepID=A0A2A5QP48_9EURY|nr:hypothetical protein CP557_21585 [Natrinema ejinorense]
MIPVEPAVNQSGNAGGDGIRFARSDEFVLTGEVVDEKPDGRKHKLARAINRFGAGGTKSVAIPTDGLEHLGVGRDAAGDGVDLELWVCADPDEDRHLIAVTPVIQREMQFTTPERGSE